jgi:RNA polymerase sigma-70 factor (ECF subfamily)
LKELAKSLSGAGISSETNSGVFAPRAHEPAAPAADLDRAGKARLVGLLRLHFGTVRRFVRRFGVPDASSDDATQEVFIVAARRLGEIEMGGERQYLYGIALRVAANARRAVLTHRDQPSSSALARLASDAPGPDAALEAKQLRALLDQVLDTMTEDLRAAFVLFELEGFSVPEIAELTGVPLGTAASRLRRARDAFHTEAASLKNELALAGATR